MPLSPIWQSTGWLISPFLSEGNQGSQSLLRVKTQKYCYRTAVTTSRTSDQITSDIAPCGRPAPTAEASYATRRDRFFVHNSYLPNVNNVQQITTDNLRDTRLPGRRRVSTVRLADWVHGIPSHSQWPAVEISRWWCECGRLTVEASYRPDRLGRKLT
jgi:hypothetical protein